MPAINQEIFTFASEKLPEERFYIAQFEGTEALNTLFHFEIVLLCAKADIDTKALAGTRAIFTIHREKGEDAVFKGYISKIVQSGGIRGYSYYTVYLLPFFEKFKLVVNSMIFLDSDLKQTIEKVISQEKHFKLDYEFRFSDRYPKKEFAMQYNERSFDYILWRLEEQGAYFYFDKGGDRVIFTDNTRLHDPSQGTVYYSPSTGLEISVLDEVVTSFRLNQAMLPSRVVVRNYDWTNPNKLHVGIAEVYKGGFGDVYLTNEKTESEEEANRIAKIRAEQILAKKRIYTGSSSVPFLRPGVVFTLTRHFSDSFNRDYIVTKIKHEGRQEALLNFVLGMPIEGDQEHLLYRNNFECIESGITYRSSNTITRARIPGSIHAFIDGDKGGEPVLDKYGRYKVWFPFDVSGRSDGKASCWIRRAQEQVGKDFGFSFPLIPGTEVLITFLNGDPDQPVIDRALPNGETGSISGGGNKNLSGIRTSGGAQITFDNKHNVLQLANATGSEITFGAGSLDYFRSSTHNKLKTAAVGSSELSGAIADNMSGYISRRRAVCKNPMLYVAGMAAAAAKTGQYIYDSLSGKAADPNEPKSDFAAQVTKLVPLIAFPKAPPYNIRLSADRKNASSRLQCFPETKEIVINMLVMLLSRAASLPTDLADNKRADNACDEEKKKINVQELDTQGKITELDTIKKNVIRNKIVGQVAGFLPEIGALIAVCIMAGNLRKKNIGGIMIDAKDKNINLHAKTYIGAHAERGIYLNTVKAKYDHDGIGDEIGHWGSPWVAPPVEEKNELRAVFNDITNIEDLDSGEDGLPLDVLNKIQQGHINTRAHRSWGETAKDDVIGPADQRRMDFIAGNTHLHVIQSKDLYQYSSGSWNCISPYIKIRAGEPRGLRNNESVREFDASYPACVSMTENDVNFFAREMIYLRGPLSGMETVRFFMNSDAISGGIVIGEGSNENREENIHGFVITDQVVYLKHCAKEDEPAEVTLSDGKVQISVLSGQDGASLSLLSGKAELHAEEVKINGVCIKDNSIAAVKDGSLDIGGAMKFFIKKTREEEFPDSDDERLTLIQERNSITGEKQEIMQDKMIKTMQDNNKKLEQQYGRNTIFK